MNKLLLFLRTVYLWLCVATIYLSGFIFVLAYTSLHFIHKDDTKLRNQCHNIACVTASLIFKAMSPWWKMDIIDQEKLQAPRNEPMVVICNHQSLTDIWAIYCLNFQFRWLSKAEVFKLPIVGCGHHILELT